MQSMCLPAHADTLAPDGSQIRLLLTLPGGSAVHCTLPAGGVSLAVNRGNAAAMFRLKPGNTVEIRAVADTEPITVQSPAVRAMTPRSR